MDFLFQARGLLWQLGVCAAAFALLALSPPARGRMWLLPLLGNANGQALAIVIARGGGLVGRGPIAGTLIVSGELSRLLPPLSATGAILLAAPGSGCGEDRS